MEVVLSSSAAPLNIVIPKLPIKSPKRPFKNLVSYIPTLKFPENTSNFSTPIRSLSTVCSCFSLKLSTNIPSPVSCSSSSKRTSAASTAATTTTTTTTTTSLSSRTRAHQRHWIVVVEPPKQDLNSKPEIIDYYVKTLERVLSSERDAQMCVYDASCDTHFGFCCDIDQEMANELARVDGVISVKPDLDFNSLEKDYSCSKVQSSLSTGSYASSSLLFPAGNTKHWLVRMDKPSTGLVSNAQIVDYFVQTLTKVMGNEKDAQMCIYHASWQPDCGFCCELDEECARELAGMAGVLAVQQDENFESDSKDYGAAIQPTNIDTKKLFITGLSFYTSEKTLRAAFDGFGELVEVKVIMDKISKRSKGYAFIEYTTEEAASMALKEMNGKIINGWMIVVDYAKSTPKYGRGRRRPAS